MEVALELSLQSDQTARGWEAPVRSVVGGNSATYWPRDGTRLEILVMGGLWKELWAIMIIH